MFMPSGVIAASAQQDPDELSLVISPSFLFGFEVNCPVSAGPATANANGGTEPYSYLWDWESGGAGINIDSPTSQSTTISKTVSGNASGVLRCTVTDFDTNTAIDSIDAELECGT